MVEAEAAGFEDRLEIGDRAAQFALERVGDDARLGSTEACPETLPYEVAGDDTRRKGEVVSVRPR